MKQIAGIDSYKFNILIVDDIPLNLTLCDMMLKSFEFTIVKANNGRQALNEIQSRLNTPDCIDVAIVDLMMPILDGYKVIEHIRQGYNEDGFNIPAMSKNKLPIIVLSALNLNEDVTKALTLGANQYLTKPIIQEQLISTLTKELEKRVKASATASATA